MRTRYAIGLSLLSGIVLGAIGVQALHAQAKPPAYAVINNYVTNPAAYVKEFAPLGGKAIVAAKIFVTDLSQKKEMDAAWTGFFGEDMPTRATVGVADLGGGAMIEIVVTASR